jgi:arylformamidase
VLDLSKAMAQSGATCHDERPPLWGKSLGISKAGASMSSDYETQYNNRARVPEHPGLIAGWARDAQAYRVEALSELGVSYGENERQRYDLFKPATINSTAIVMFIHGGYWQALDRSFFSHMARGLNARGVPVAVVGYDLCPDVELGHIVWEIQQAAAALWRRYGLSVVASGHSAGGHIAACLLATNWAGVDDDLPEQLVPAAYGISGIVLDAVVGGAESEEYFKQSRRIVDVWGLSGVQTRYEEIAGANHFTVIAGLADPDNAMTRRIAELAGA